MIRSPELMEPPAPRPFSPVSVSRNQRASGSPDGMIRENGGFGGIVPHTSPGGIAFPGARNMSDWLHNLPVAWMALVVFGLTYLVAAAIYAVVTVLAVRRRTRSFKAAP